MVDRRPLTHYNKIILPKYIYYVIEFYFTDLNF